MAQILASTDEAKTSCPPEVASNRCVTSQHNFCSQLETTATNSMAQSSSVSLQRRHPIPCLLTQLSQTSTDQKKAWSKALFSLALSFSQYVSFQAERVIVISERHGAKHSSLSLSLSLSSLSFRQLSGQCPLSLFLSPSCPLTGWPIYLSIPRKPDVNFHSNVLLLQSPLTSWPIYRSIT